MKMLNNKQIKKYLKMAKYKSKRLKKKAISRLRKDLKVFGQRRVEICKKMLLEIQQTKSNI